MTESTPLTHIAFIPDGNRRWARQQGIGSDKKIYEQGSDGGYEIIAAAFARGIPYVSFWASSYANLRARPRALVGAIEALYVRKFQELARHPLIHDHHVKVEVHGEWSDMLRPATRAAIKKAMAATTHYKRHFLTILVGYDGQRELGAAVQTLLARRLSAAHDPIESHEQLRATTWTGHLPDVDLVVRTGAWQDPHNSAGFLSLLTAESQFAFPKVLWPDFTPAHLHEVLKDYAARERRHGT